MDRTDAQVGLGRDLRVLQPDLGTVERKSAGYSSAISSIIQIFTPISYSQVFTGNRITR